jgi:hypothetical protein
MTDSIRRLEMRRAHAKHAYTCSCGRTVYGNGGKAHHRAMHARRKDQHHYVAAT